MSGVNEDNMERSKQRILVADAIASEAVALLEENAQVDALTSISAEELVEKISDYHALIVRGRSQVTAEVISAAANLKVVGRAGVGVDNVDLAACSAQGIMVVNAPLGGTIAVAEHTLGLMLALVRHIAAADAAMKAGGWPKKQSKGTELYQKTLGLVGIGRIGAAVAERAAAFGMRIAASDPFLTAEQIRSRGAEPLTFDAVLAEADILSIHSPLTDETRGMINEAAIRAMRPGVLLICAARGGVVDETALLAALESGHVGGAGLDVFATEPPGEIPLVQHSRVVATPHIGAQTTEAQKRAGMDIAAEVLAGLRGEGLRWHVNAAIEVS